MYGYLFCPRNPSYMALFESFLLKKSNKSTGFAQNIGNLYAYLNRYLYLRDKSSNAETVTENALNRYLHICKAIAVSISRYFVFIVYNCLL